MHDEAKTAKALQIKMLADDQAETLYIVTGAQKWNIHGYAVIGSGIPAVTDRVENQTHSTQGLL